MFSSFSTSAAEGGEYRGSRDLCNTIGITRVNWLTQKRGKISPPPLSPAQAAKQEYSLKEKLLEIL